MYKIIIPALTLTAFIALGYYSYDPYPGTYTPEQVQALNDFVQKEIAPKEKHLLSRAEFNKAMDNLYNH